MARIVRKNQSISDVIYNGENIVLIDQSRELRLNETNKEINYVTTAIVCDGHYLGVGSVNDYGAICYYAIWHDPWMTWKNYTKYFGIDVRVLACYLKKDRGNLDDCACELATFVHGHVREKVLLVGHSKGGIVMYSTGRKLASSEEKSNRKVTVMTVSTPFGGTPLGDKEEFLQLEKEHSKLVNKWYLKLYSGHQGDLDVSVGADYIRDAKGLPYNVNHMAFTSVIPVDDKKSVSISDWAIKKLDKWAHIKGDGIVSFDSQTHWPVIDDEKTVDENGIIRIKCHEREPDLHMVVMASHVTSLDTVLNDFGKYAASEFYFSMMKDFAQSEYVKKLIE